MGEGGAGGPRLLYLSEEKFRGKRGPGFGVLGQSPGPCLCPSQIATCHSRNGNPAPQITWYRNGQRLRVPMEVNTGEPRRGGRLDGDGAAAPGAG